MDIRKTPLKYIKKYVGIILTGIAAIIAHLLLELGLPYINMKIIDEGINAQNIYVMVRLTVFILVLNLLKYVFSIISVFVFSYISKKFALALFENALSTLFSKKRSFYVENSTGTILQCINEIWQLEDIFNPNTIESLFSIFTLFFAVGVLFSVYGG